MGNLYWLSLANSLTDYYWFNLLKRNRFWHGVTVLLPKCYTLEVELRTIDTVYNIIIAQLREPGLCKVNQHTPTCWLVIVINSN